VLLDQAGHDASSTEKGVHHLPSLRCPYGCLLVAVRPEGADHQWRRIPPGELSIDPVADERLVRATVRAGAS
jgi:hypothetical protein